MHRDIVAMTSNISWWCHC